MSERPILARFFLAAALAFAPGAFAEEPPLDESEAIRRALARPALDERLRAHVELARAEEIAARAWPNPEASWSREQIESGGTAAREDLAVLSQRLDLSGRRGLRGAAAARRVEAAGAEAALLRLDVVAETRHAFADALAADRRAGLLRAAARRLEALARAAGRRAASGDVAGYDRRRVERERLATLARLDLEEGAAVRARARLAALIGAPDPTAPIGLRGDLAVEPPPPLAALVDPLPSRPDLLALAHEARAGELEARAAGRWFLPELELSGGLKTVDDGSRRDTGFAAAVTIPLPLLSRDRDERLRGEARARSARSRLALALAAAQADVAGLHAEATGLAAAASRHRERSGDGAALLAAAEAAYRGGEVGALELVDAHRAALDADLSLVELEWAARRARIDLDRTSGGATR